MFRILGIGELLWDMLPAGPQLGGAPANYAVMAARLGNDAAILSRIGNDALGAQAEKILRSFPVNCAWMQVDDTQSTGQVTVTLVEGQPTYLIHQPAAWDFLELTQAWRNAAAQADALGFGSLAQRSVGSRQTIQAVLGHVRRDCLRIFDVNLRAPFYNAEIVRQSIEAASVVKMNDAEVPLVSELLGLPPSASLREDAERLLAAFTQLTLVAITRGGQGSVLVGQSEWHEHHGVPIQVADTIGAGDAFTAAMTHYLLRGAPLETVNEAGNRWGSFVASQHGAMPEIPDEIYNRIQREIEG